MTLMCSCTLPDPKFTVKPMTSSNPVLCVGHEYVDFIEIKNVSKYSMVLHISGKVVEINEKVRMNPDETKKFRVRYAST